jgi:hypothetical protein
MGDRVVTFERDWSEVNILASYHYFKRIDLGVFLETLFGKVRPRVFLDSGAWSAFTMGAEIALDDYIAYCHRHAAHLWTYCNLDHMRDPDITVANQREMERQGLSPMPAFHVGEPWRYLEDYAAEYDHLAIGRIVPFTSRPKVIIPYIGKCFRVVGTRAKVHGLGVSNTTLLKLFPWTTSDSSAWGAGFRYGRMELFDPLHGGFRAFNYHGHRTFNEFQELLREHDFARWNYFDVPDDKWKSARRKLGPLQANAYLKMNEWMRKRHGNDYRFFFAGTNSADFSYVRDVHAAKEAA